MNLKHEMFWNLFAISLKPLVISMNLKHEMFWNYSLPTMLEYAPLMNLKHEMFWNSYTEVIILPPYNEP